MIFKTKLVGLQRGEQTGVDRYGNPIYGPDIEVPFYGELRPLVGDENLVNRELVITRFRMFIPRTVIFTAFDKVRYDGKDYQFVGHPEPHNIGGRIHHHEVVVERATG
ncbi:hypothetical protein [Microlunatus sp. Y2014]|uniref:hypothetical protein n=1 Tax=Microlunatus sp. Y2014 TaxID=3418488 RepID=UPI003DA6FAFA